ncbi:MAG: YHS domain-containing protein [Candidatus Diapherotrites archaeon]|nr:YHS domain-containing protein [Candidatus Diapherotrites archaeon]
MTRDVVCGMNVSPGTAQSTYLGETYYFCCSGCKNRFEQNPEKFVKKGMP